MDKLKAYGYWGYSLNGYYANLVRGLRAWEEPTEVRVYDLSGKYLRTEQPVEFGRRFNSKRLTQTDLGDK